MILSNNSVSARTRIERLLLAAVRGDTSVDSLNDVGIEINQKDDGFYSLKSNLDVGVTPTISDVASGILRYCSNDEDTLRKWAFLLLAETAIDFRRIESHPQGEMLIGALWEASFKGEISREVIAVAEKIKLGAR